MLPQATAEFYRAQGQLGLMTVVASRREWARMGENFDVSWLTVGPRLGLLASSAQLGAARQAQIYVPKVLAETGQHAPAEGALVPESLAGYASDGRTLGGLLYGAVTTAKTTIATGTSQRPVTGQEALSAGGDWLDMALQTLVADAGRIASSIGIAARPRITGYVRMLSGPGCPRCAVLAGKWYRYNTGFLRHPRCHCVHIPASENVAADYRTDPRAAFDAGRITGLTDAQTKAIHDGADIGQVVNATRGMSTTVDVRAGRLTPEGIYKRATDRQDAIALLHQYGYLT